MNDHSETAGVRQDEIEAKAAAWLVERDAGLTAEQAVEFDCWRAANPRHEAAVAMLEQTRELLEHLPILRASPALKRRVDELGRGEPERENVVRFPRVLKIAAALAACLTISFALWFVRPDGAAFDAAYATATDDYRRIVLPDHSEIELNANTRVHVTFSRAQRQLTLTEGEAHFTVAKDPARPFMVKAGDIGVRAVGTAFNVRFRAADVEVLVTEGRVHVGKTSSSTSQPLQAYGPPALVSAGERVVFSTGADAIAAPQVITADAAAIQQTLAWQNPLLVFADTPLTEVIGKFNRYNRVRLEIGDEELKARAVGGRFQADQVESFLRLLEQSGDIAVHRPGLERIVLRKGSPSPKP